MGRIDTLIDKHKLGDAREAIKAMLSPALALVPSPGRGSLGAHRLGGVPDLPADMDWPSSIEEPGEPLAFLLQLNLGQLPVDGLGLPDRGILWVFIGQDVPATEVEHRVLYRADPGALVPRERAPSKVFASYGSLTPCTLFAARQLALPGIGVGDKRLRALGDALRGSGPLRTATRLGGPLLGYADDPRTSAYVRHDLERPDLIWASKRAQDKQWNASPAHEHREGAERWKALLQIGSHEAAKLTFTDAGTLTVLVREDALAAGDFSQSYAVIDSA